MKIANGTFSIESWDEETYQQTGKDAKLTQAHVMQKFEGDIHGKGSVEYLMSYVTEMNARFTGQQLIEGMIEDRKGSFVLHLNGIFDGSEVKANWEIMPDSGTGELKYIQGKGTFKAPLGQSATYSLEYSFKE